MVSLAALALAYGLWVRNDRRRRKERRPAVTDGSVPWKRCFDPNLDPDAAARLLALACLGLRARRLLRATLGPGRRAAARDGRRRPSRTRWPGARSPAAAGGPLVRGLPDFSPLVDRYGPAVVNVEVVEKPQPRSGGPTGLSPNDPFYDFFRASACPRPDQGERRPRQPPVRGAGSGFIVSADGYILTNAHVVANADEVTVRLTDRREFTAKVIGADERTDVAVIKIDAQQPADRASSAIPRSLKPGRVGARDRLAVRLREQRDRRHRQRHRRARCRARTTCPSSRPTSR